MKSRLGTKLGRTGFQTWAVALGFAAVSANAQLSGENVRILRAIYDDAVQAVYDVYEPEDRIKADFKDRMAPIRDDLGRAKSLDDGCLIVADAFMAFDPTIRLYVLSRQTELDYGFNFRMVGDSAIVHHVDSDADARQKGLRPGDRLKSIEKAALTRASYRQIVYALRDLAPKPALRLVVESPGSVERGLTVLATPRPSRLPKTPRRESNLRLSTQDKQRFEEYKDLKAQLKRVGDVVVWRAIHLGRESDDIDAVVASLKDAKGLIIDLRGLYLFRHLTVTQLLSALCDRSFELARIERKNGKTVTLEVRGKGKFSGHLLVLIDSETAGYGELLAWAIQEQKRGVIVGDRTMGQVRHEYMAAFTRYTIPESITYTQVQQPDGSMVPVRNLTPATEVSGTTAVDLGDVFYDPTVVMRGVRIPGGDVILPGGRKLHGVGVTPDYLLLPKPSDIAAKRDVVLSRALQMLKQTVTPEEAFRLFRNDWDDRELFLDPARLH